MAYNKILATPTKAPVDSLVALATPSFRHEDSSNSIILYSKAKQPVAVINIQIPEGGLYNILYDNKLYTYIDGLFTETDVYMYHN